jgi:hypothetical protein
MIARVLAALASALAPCCLMAQLQLSIVEGSGEKPAGAVVDAGSIAVGEYVDLAFRIRNSGPGAVALTKLYAGSQAFRYFTSARLPLTMLAGATLDFTVRFQPLAPEGASAMLYVNDATYLLVGKGLPGLMLWVDQGVVASPVGTGNTIEFGSLKPGSSATEHLRLDNKTASALAVQTIRVSGAGFRGPVGAAAPLDLAAGGSVKFDIVWEPAGAGSADGMLEINGRAYKLHGNGLEPPFQQPHISFDKSAGSAKQVKLSIHFDGPAQSNGTGQLTMEFVGKSDPAIQFLSPAGRTAPFTVRAGESYARFQDQPEVVFQTGTTAGEIRFTAVLDNYSVQDSLTIAPIPVAIDAGTLNRTSGMADLRVSGFDNTRSAGMVAFRFYDRNNRLLGVANADATPLFKAHFENSTAGGLFTLHAVFPVTGNTGQIDSVDVEITNSAGTGRKNVKIVE